MVNNHLQVGKGDTHFSLKTQNIILLIFIVGVGVLSWLRIQVVKEYLDRLNSSQSYMLEIINHREENLTNELESLKKMLRIHEHNTQSAQKLPLDMEHNK